MQVLLQTILSIKEINLMTPEFLDNNFLSLLQDLPPEIESLAVEHNAFLRQRILRTPLELLRVVLLYCICDLSLRHIAGLLTGSRRKITDEAIRLRLNGCRGWVEEIVKDALQQNIVLPDCGGRRIVICDGSTVSALGSRKSDFRLHLSFDPLFQQTCQLRVTSYRKGESLILFEFAPDDIVLADRSFAKAPQLLSVIDRGADFVVRCSPQYLKLLTSQGEPFDLIAALRASCASSIVSFEVKVCDAKTNRTLPAWIHARRLTEEQISRARRKARRKSKSGGKTIKEETLFLCEWVLVLTSIAPASRSGEVIMELYRVRWQIELVIKRLKSLLDGAKLRASKEGKLAQVWLWGKMLYAVMVEKAAMRRCGSEWTQMKEGRRATWWRVWRMVSMEIKQKVLDTTRWEGMDWQAILRAMSERGRKRKLQTLPEEVLKWMQGGHIAQPIAQPM